MKPDDSVPRWWRVSAALVLLLLGLAGLLGLFVILRQVAVAVGLIGE